jgi:hypothetical protein
MNPNGLSTGVRRVKDATIAVIRGGRDAASAATQQKSRKTQEDAGRRYDAIMDGLPSTSTI